MEQLDTEISRIIELSNAFGPSGYEDEVSSLVINELEEIGLEAEEDCLRNVRTFLSNKKDRPTIMLDSHLDEVGLIVQAIKPNGVMKFLPLGGWANASFPNSRFILKNKDGENVPAVVGVKPVHFMNESERGVAPQVSDMFLDCGATSDKEVVEDLKLGISSFGVPDVKANYDEARRLFSGKAFDCRIGVACEIEVLKRLKGKKIKCNVAGSFSTQEEIGERGVYANYKSIQPDIMICFEGCPADDTFGESYMIQSGLRRGPMLRHFDRSMVTNPRFQRFALDLAKQKKIPVQESVRSGGGTNAGLIHTEGIPAIVIGVPVRYIHSSYCYCTLEDYQASVELAVEICKKLDKETIQSY